MISMIEIEGMRTWSEISVESMKVFAPVESSGEADKYQITAWVSAMQFAIALVIEEIFARKVLPRFLS